LEENVPDLMVRWRDFYELVGTAAVILMGLVFVTAAIAAGFLAEESRALMRSFLTPTVAHFVATLVVCILVSVPTLTGPRLGAVLLAAGVLGLLYTISVWRSMSRSARHWAALDDRLWYALAPIVCFILLSAAGILLLVHRLAGTELLAGTLVLLLLLGIRNAWDIIVWIVLRAPTK
jgi:hypothetical protein